MPDKVKQMHDKTAAWRKEVGVRAPTRVLWSGRVARGSTSDRVSGFEDWTPTPRDLVGGLKDVPVGIDGVSLAPTLLGENKNLASISTVSFRFTAATKRSGLEVGRPSARR
ncbi:MAG: hypothetical protein N2C14_29165 [Planctomycetales bacterium]